MKILPLKNDDFRTGEQFQALVAIRVKHDEFCINNDEFCS